MLRAVKIGERGCKQNNVSTKWGKTREQWKQRDNVHDGPRVHKWSLSQRRANYFGDKEKEKKQKQQRIQFSEVKRNRMGLSLG